MAQPYRTGDSEVDRIFGIPLNLLIHSIPKNLVLRARSAIIGAVVIDRKCIQV
jgi:hypothetical protein